MGISRIHHSRFVAYAAVASFAACGGSQPMGALGVVPQSSPVPARANRGTSWMLPEAKKDTLLYASLDRHRVGVFDYDNGKQVGSLSGFDDPYGGCVNAKGDVYIAEYFSGDVVEYAHGSTKRLKTFTTTGQASGCSVNGGGDLAVTDRDTRTGPGQVCVWATANSESAPKCYSGLPPCGMMAPAGYDDKDNLFIPGEDNTTAYVCVLRAGAASITELPLNYTFNTPGAAMWDGKHMTLSDQGANGHEEAIIRVKISGSKLRDVGRTLLGDTCYRGWETELAPFILGVKNTPVNREQSKVVTADNTVCADQGVKLWKYAAGGYPYRAITSAEGVVLAVSIAE